MDLKSIMEKTIRTAGNIKDYERIATIANKANNPGLKEMQVEANRFFCKTLSNLSDKMFTFLTDRVRDKDK